MNYKEIANKMVEYIKKGYIVKILDSSDSFLNNILPYLRNVSMVSAVDSSIIPVRKGTMEDIFMLLDSQRSLYLYKNRKTKNKLLISTSMKNIYNRNNKLIRFTDIEKIMYPDFNIVYSDINKDYVFIHDIIYEYKQGAHADYYIHNIKNDLETRLMFHSGLIIITKPVVDSNCGYSYKSIKEIEINHIYKNKEFTQTLAEIKELKNKINSQIYKFFNNKIFEELDINTLSSSE